jgi:hypothetical protein
MGLGAQRRLPLAWVPEDIVKCDSHVMKSLYCQETKNSCSQDLKRYSATPDFRPGRWFWFSYGLAGAIEVKGENRKQKSEAGAVFHGKASKV